MMVFPVSLSSINLTPWQQVALTMGLGILAGLALILMVRRRRSPEDVGVLDTAMREADVEEIYSRAIAQLRELSEQAHTMDAAYVAAERQRQEGRAAALLSKLRALQATREAEPTKGAPKNPRGRGHKEPGLGVGFLRRSPKLVGALWGAGFTAVGLFLMQTVQEGAVPRPSPPVAAPAEAAAGPGAGELDKARFEELQAKIKANDTDVPALLELAHMLLRVQLLEEAQVINDRALALEGNNLEALTHAAVLAAGRGETAGAQAGLTAVLQKDPGFAEAWFFRGMLSMQAGDMDTMQSSLQQFVRLAPDGPQKERVRGMLGRARATP